MRLRRERLRELRLLRQWTQSDVADLLDCSRATVSTWETTGRPPRPATMRALAALFGVPVFDLVETDLLDLRMMRSASGMRQQDIAQLLGVRASTYCAVEKGTRALPGRWVPIISRAFSVPVDLVRGLAPARLTKGSGGGANS
ncbi:helix-turn-helix transcriptional regulator [Streptomyces sp. NPDC045456]|uniref:helix-turn-helix transcriptional regulator n=1 Tax=Streptomyces sp. NPDC045456 TaxID=3155254 RepID=UPI0034077ED6